MKILSKNGRAAGWALALLLGANPVAWATDEAAVEPLGIQTVQAETAGKTIQQDPAHVVADRFGVLPTQVEAWRNSGRTWSDIVYALAIAEQSNRTPEQVWLLKDQGIEWSAAATRYDLTWERVNEEAHEVFEVLSRQGADLTAPTTAPLTIETPGEAQPVLR